MTRPGGSRGKTLCCSPRRLVHWKPKNPHTSFAFQNARIVSALGIILLSVDTSGEYLGQDLGLGSGLDFQITNLPNYPILVRLIALSNPAINCFLASVASPRGCSPSKILISFSHCKNSGAGFRLNSLRAASASWKLVDW